jgi:hypothetical protein
MKNTLFFLLLFISSTFFFRKIKKSKSWIKTCWNSHTHNSQKIYNRGCYTVIKSLNNSPIKVNIYLHLFPQYYFTKATIKAFIAEYKHQKVSCISNICVIINNFEVVKQEHTLSAKRFIIHKNHWIYFYGCAIQI